MRISAQSSVGRSSPEVLKSSICMCWVDDEFSSRGSSTYKVLRDIKHLKQQSSPELLQVLIECCISALNFFERSP
jgi:hypothetical protein